MRLDDFEQTLGHRFSDPELLRTALTHRSQSAKNNERLEFLGDSVLNCIIAAELFRRFPNLAEGELSRVRAVMVRQQTLFERAEALQIGDRLQLGEGELRSGGKQRPSILADALEAIVSAVQAVKGAIPGAELIEASPDFVGLTDVADLVGCSRQNIRKLMISNPETFPAAVHEGSQAFWHLRPVLVWFSETQKRPIDRSLIEVSEVTMKVNIAKETRRMSGVGLLKELETLFA